MVMPGIRGNWGIPGLNSAHCFLMLTGWFYDTVIASGAIHSTNERFVWLPPKSPTDRASGGFCSATGYWCAGRGMVTVDGKKYIRQFAPRHNPQNDV